MTMAVKNLLKPIFDSVQNLLSNLKFGNEYCIGLDMGIDRLNLVQMERSSGKMHIRAIASIPYPCTRAELQNQPQTLKSLLKQAFETQPFKGKRVVSSLPTDQMKIITISYNKSESQSDADAVVAELRERFKTELDNMVVDFMSLRQDDADLGKQDALVAMAPREKVLAYLNLLNQVGLDVEALDIGPAALTRLVCHAGAIFVPEYPTLPNVLLVNFGADSSFLTIIWGRRLMLDRPIEFSENRLFSRMKQVLDMPEDLMMSVLYENKPNQVMANGNTSNEINQMVEEVLRPEMAVLMQEINKTLVYMASKTRGKSISQIYLAGRVARYPGIINYLREQLQVPVAILDPVEVFAAEKYKSGQTLGTMAGIALTTGLALRGVNEHG